MDKLSRTRTALLRAALELFDERGYDATTAAAIAGRAGVSEMTFFRHFASKDAVLVDDPYDPLIADAVSRQPVELPPLAAAVAGVREAWGAVPAPAGNEVRDRLRIVSRTPSLRGAARPEQRCDHGRDRGGVAIPRRVAAGCGALPRPRRSVR